MTQPHDVPFAEALPVESNLYDQMKAARVEIANHESDLYVPVNDVTTALIKKYLFKASVTTFTSTLDKKLWYDIPFAYSVVG